MTQDNFCVMPWVGMFYRIDQARVCCGHTFRTASPADLRDSPTIVQVKKDLLANRRPESCSRCWQAEDQGMISLRNLYMGHFDNINRSDYTDTSQHGLEYLELRIDNLCNFACRICDADSSTLLSSELEKYPQLKPYLGIRLDQEIKVTRQITEEHWQQILDQISSLKALQLTGGEPMLIKKFYDVMDLLIEKGIAKNLTLMITTNCSVVNPQILQRLAEFKKVWIIASIDAVGKVAEYQRHGTNWSIVEKNILTFLSLPNCHLNFNGTLTAYSVLDFANTCKFFVNMYEIKEELGITFNMVANRDHIHPTVLDGALRKKAIDQLKEGLEIMANRVPFVDHIAGMLHTVQTVDNRKDFAKFVNYTRDHDQIRNESFEQVFGHKLY